MSTKRERDDAREKRIEEIMAKIDKLGVQLVSEIDKGENPHLEIPIRGSSNVFFDEKAKKIVLGDKIWGGGQPTARNIGNTNLRVKIWQNDFGLGQSESGWNIRYEARVGESGTFTVYEPEKSGLLPEILPVGQSSSLDFGVLIEKFPPAGTVFSGQMLLTAEAAPFPLCALN